MNVLQPILSTQDNGVMTKLRRANFLVNYSDGESNKYI